LLVRTFRDIEIAFVLGKVSLFLLVSLFVLVRVFVTFFCIRLVLVFLVLVLFLVLVFGISVVVTIMSSVDVAKEGLAVGQGFLDVWRDNDPRVLTVCDRPVLDLASIVLVPVLRLEDPLVSIDSLESS